MCYLVRSVYDLHSFICLFIANPRLHISHIAVIFKPIDEKFQVVRIIPESVWF